MNHPLVQPSADALHGSDTRRTNARSKTRSVAKKKKKNNIRRVNIRIQINCTRLSPEIAHEIGECMLYVCVRVCEYVHLFVSVRDCVECPPEDASSSARYECCVSNIQNMRRETFEHGFCTRPPTQTRRDDGVSLCVTIAISQSIARVNRPAHSVE